MATNNKNNRRGQEISTIALLILFFTAILIPFGLAQPPSAADNSQSEMVISTIEEFPRIAQAVADYYYEDDACRESFTSALGLFSGQVSAGTVRKVSLA